MRKNVPEEQPLWGVGGGPQPPQPEAQRADGSRSAATAAASEASGLVAFRRKIDAIQHTARLKTYPGGEFEIMAATKPIFREKGWESADVGAYYAPTLARKLPPKGAAAQPECEHTFDQGDGAPKDCTGRAARRAAARVRDLALANDFTWFVTLTLDQDKVNRYDDAQVIRKLNQWLSNQVRRCGLRYVIVPERHKDGALHFHGFVNDVPGMEHSGTWITPEGGRPRRPRSEAQRKAWAAAGNDGGYHPVYNWLRWTYGFTTAIRLHGEYSHAVAYVCKYVRKQASSGKTAGRWYYSGGELREPAVELLDVELEELKQQPELYTFQVPEAGFECGILRGKFSEFEAEFTKAGKSNPAAAAAGEGAPAPSAAENNVDNIR